MLLGSWPSALQTPGSHPRPLEGRGRQRSSAPQLTRARNYNVDVCLLAPRNADREAEEDPRAQKTWQLLPPATPVTSVRMGKAFLP